MAYLGQGNNNVVELRNTRFRYTATEGQTSFTGADANGTSLVNIDSGSAVFLNGSRLSIDGDYTVAGGNTLTLTTAAYLNDIIEIVEITQVTVTDAGGAAKRSGDTFTGNAIAPDFRMNRSTQATDTSAVKRSESPWLGSNSIIRSKTRRQKHF